MLLEVYGMRRKRFVVCSRTEKVDLQAQEIDHLASKHTYTCAHAWGCGHLRNGGSRDHVAKSAKSEKHGQEERSDRGAVTRTQGDNGWQWQRGEERTHTAVHV